MPAANIDSTSRKVSGSSSHSAGHSPSNSPGNPQRKLASGGSNDMFGSGVSSKGLKGYNAGWHVWGGPGSKRTASVSSMNELAPPSGEGYAWSQSRASSGSWDEAPGSQKKEEHSALYARQRQATAAQAAALSGSGGFAVTGGAYAAPTGYDSNGAPSVDDLASALRGMAVADEHGGAPSAMPQPRTAVSYSPYYSGQAGQGDFAYGYADASSFTPAGMATGASTPGVFYDYGASARPPASPYYYPSQPMMWNPSPSPMLTPQLAAAVPATYSEKKRELQFNVQQSAQMNHQNLMYQQPLRSPTSPMYPSLDYSGQMSMMMPTGAVYGHSRSNSQSGASQRSRRDDLGHLRSELLEEFRANKTRKWDLRDIFGHIAEFSGDQHGSRFIQQKLESASMEEKEVVFNEIVPAHSLQLSQDVFGNYVIQKLFEFGTPTQKALLATTLEGHILTLSLQIYGCRVIQKAVESVSESQQTTFVNELEPHVIRCVKDANGNHVIQKVIERVSPRSLGFVNSFRGHVYELASHPYGCRVLQRCFEYLAPEQTRPLLDELHECTLDLMQDQFGNYVIQFVLERGSPQDRAEVVHKLKGQLLDMARHKFASNVCEKALVTADAEARRALIEEVMTTKADGVSPIVVMMKDQFANYVLQRAVVVAAPEQKEILISRIRPQLVSMRRYNNAYTKHLIAIERLLDKCAKAQEAAALSEAAS